MVSNLRFRELTLLPLVRSPLTPNYLLLNSFIANNYYGATPDELAHCRSTQYSPFLFTVIGFIEHAETAIWQTHDTRFAHFFTLV